METNNILRELSEIIDNTNENIKYAIGLWHVDPTRLLEADRQTNELAKIIKEFNIEKSCKNQAYCFILENGYVNEFREYCARNPLNRF
jgi:hypothetical protein